MLLTPIQRNTLQRLKRRQRSSQQLVRRVRIILEAANTGASNTRIAELLGIDRGQEVRTWRKRWLEAAPRLIAAEEEAREKAAAAAAATTTAADDEDEDDESGGNGVLLTEVLEEVVEEVLADEPRCGTPPSFGPEQVVRIVALACEDPRECGRPVTHWTPPELADEAKKRGIVESISPRSVGRFLGRGGSETPQDTLLAQQRAGQRAGGLRRGG
ncbi:MAG: helix-turn-helix domain-containing protein [Actinobacteria bacterium]|nr:helix-turn-helix domain-containing protein [Actinomycetota bacterium]